MPNRACEPQRYVNPSTIDDVLKRVFTWFKKTISSYIVFRLEVRFTKLVTVFNAYLSGWAERRRKKKLFRCWNPLRKISFQRKKGQPNSSLHFFPVPKEEGRRARPPPSSGKHTLSTPIFKIFFSHFPRKKRKPQHKNHFIVFPCRLLFCMHALCFFCIPSFPNLFSAELFQD